MKTSHPAWGGDTGRVGGHGGIHLADVVFGRVRRNGDRLAWHPVDD